jgi:hypothetical protein
MLASIALSRAGTRSPSERPWQGGAAYWAYLGGVAALLFSMFLTVWLL